MFNDFPRRARIADVASDHEPRRHRGPARHRAVAGDPRGAGRLGRRRTPLPRRPPTSSTAWSSARRQQARRRPRRQDRRPRRRDHRTRLDQRRQRRAAARCSGRCTDDLAALAGPHDAAASFGGGWYGYVDKDLRTLLGSRVRDPFRLRYCGNGSLSACRASLWARAQGSGGRARRRPGPGSRRSGARTRPRSGSSSRRASCRTRCASRTGRPSSRCCASGASTRPAGRRFRSRRPVGRSVGLTGSTGSARWPPPGRTPASPLPPPATRVRAGRGDRRTPGPRPRPCRRR